MEPAWRSNSTSLSIPHPLLLTPPFWRNESREKKKRKLTQDGYVLAFASSIHNKQQQDGPGCEKKEERKKKRRKRGKEERKGGKGKGKKERENMKIV
jgi:hypothetical protein